LAGSRCAADETAIDCGKVLVVGGSDNDLIHDCEQVGRSVELYDPKSNLWVEKDPLPPAQAYNTPLTTPLEDGRVLLVGRRSKVGSSPEQCRASTISWADVYDPIAARWTTVPDAPPFGGTQQGLGELALLKDGRVLVISGDASSLPAIFDPAGMSWKPTGACACVGVQRPKLTSLEDGRVLMEGGYDPVQNSEIDRAMIFEPADDSWTPIYPMNQKRGGLIHQAWLLQGNLVQCRDKCGAVLVFGGTSSPDDPSELYFPVPRLNAISPAEGLTTGGELVTITGTGLAAAVRQGSSVTFGADNAKAVLPDPEGPSFKMQVVTPAHAAGTVPVIVTTIGGVSMSVPFTFKAPPPPITKDPGPIPGGSADGAPGAPSAPEAAPKVAPPAATGPGSFAGGPAAGSANVAVAQGAPPPPPAPPGAVAAQVPGGQAVGAQVPGGGPAASAGFGHSSNLAQGQTVGASMGGAEESSEPAPRFAMSGLQRTGAAPSGREYLATTTLLISFCCGTVVRRRRPEAVMDGYHFVVVRPAPKIA